MYKGFIFDMDGVMLLSEEYQLVAFNDVLKHYGVSLPEDEWYADYAGYIDTVIASKIIDRYDLHDDPRALAEKKRAAYLELFRTGIVPPAQGLIHTVSTLAEHLTLGVASNGSLAEIETVTEAFGIRTYFKGLASGHEVPQGKPAPDVYLLAVERLGLEPNECVAVEDTPLGITAAKTAGLMTIGIVTTHKKEDLTGAAHIVNSLEEIPSIVLP
jgi:beta-phosphoglucomutase